MLCRPITGARTSTAVEVRCRCTFVCVCVWICLLNYVTDCFGAAILCCIAQLTYHKVRLISACAYHSQWQGNMRLLDNVRLIESEVLAPPTASTFERSITKRASYEHSDSWNKLCNSSWEYDWKPLLRKLWKNNRLLWRDSLRRQGQESKPVSVEHHGVEYSRSRAAGYPKVGW